MIIRTVFVYLFYWAGDFVSKLMHALDDDFPRTPERIFDFLYRIYAKFMIWSSNLDVDEKLWLPYREDWETVRLNVPSKKV